MGLGLILVVTATAGMGQQTATNGYAFGRAPAATPAAPPPASAKRSAAELEKLAAPIALHPDSLLAILLPASAYPVEIVQAARFVKDTNNISKLDDQPWDDNVKAVAEIPALIAQMDANLDWTINLGQAFIEQPKELMDTIQMLRAKAQKAGTLQSTAQQVITVTNMVVEKIIEQQVVVVTNTVVQIQSANPQVVYVPTYPATVYYPPPGYVYDPWAPLVTFGAGIAVGAIIANNCDWHGGGVYVGHHGAVVWGGGGYHGDVDVNVNRNINYNQNVNVNQSVNRTANTGTSVTPQKWQPDQSRLSTSGAPSASTRESRGWGSASSTGARPSTGTVGARPSTGTSVPRPSTGTPAPRPAPVSRPAASPGVSRPNPAPAVSRPAPSPSVSRPPGTSNRSAFGGVSSGSSSRSYSNRGSASRGTASRSGGFSGARGGGGRGGGGRR
jgi:uncharacterized membrane protein YgcG